MHKILRLFILNLVISLGLSGCARLYEKPGDPRYSPVIPDSQSQVMPQNGSLFVGNRGLALYEDMKAKQIGDIITVILTETTASNKKSETKLRKKSRATILDPKLLGTGPKFDFPKQLPIPLITTDNLNLATTIDANRTFDGKGDSNQSNSLNGTITVTVTQIHPNGNLFIRGEKWITLTQGDEFIRISGIVRPQDISPDNTLISSRIADARITYSGRGDVHNTNKPGWMMKILGSKLWPI
jgi:flagellar L-ring protein precursor FlgH